MQVTGSRRGCWEEDSPSQFRGGDLLCARWDVVDGVQVLEQWFSTLGAHGNHLGSGGAGAGGHEKDIKK